MLNAQIRNGDTFETGFCCSVWCRALVYRWERLAGTVYNRRA